jgi:hypothetical protein
LRGARFLMYIPFSALRAPCTRTAQDAFKIRSKENTNN